MTVKGLTNDKKRAIVVRSGESLIPISDNLCNRPKKGQRIHNVKTLTAIGFLALALSAATGCISQSTGKVNTAGEYDVDYRSTDPIAMTAQLSVNKQNEMLAKAYAKAIESGRMPYGQGGIGAPTDMYYCPNGSCPSMPSVEQPAQPAAAPASAPATSAAPAATPQASTADSNADAMAIAKKALEQSEDALRASLSQ